MSTFIFKNSASHSSVVIILIESKSYQLFKQEYSKLIITFCKNNIFYVFLFGADIYNQFSNHVWITYEQSKVVTKFFLSLENYLSRISSQNIATQNPLFTHNLKTLLSWRKKIKFLCWKDYKIPYAELLPKSFQNGVKFNPCIVSKFWTAILKWGL